MWHKLPVLACTPANSRREPEFGMQQRNFHKSTTYLAGIGQIISDPANAGYVFNPGLNQLAICFKVDVPVQEYPAVVNAHLNVMLIDADIAVENAADLLSDSKIGNTSCHNRSG